MYAKFTAQARKVMQRAVEEARRLNHEYVGTEHILLALLAEGTGAAAVALTKLGLDQQLRRQMLKAVQPGRETISNGMLPQTPPAKRALEYAIEEAQLLEQSSVGTGHLLLGLLRDPDGLPAQIFQDLDVQVAVVRGEVARHSDAETSATQIAQGLPPHNATASESSFSEEWTHLRYAEPTAMQVFFAWEKLRIVYNLVLLIVVASVAGAAVIDRLPHLSEVAVVANLLFCGGSVVENYVAWLGVKRRPTRWFVFGIGMLLAIFYAFFVTQRIMRRLPVWPGFPEGVNHGL